MTLTVRIVEHIRDVPAVAWDALVGHDNPFLEHAFLLGLEESSSVGHRDTGWLPHHVLAYRGDTLVAALPLYERYDSYGEFIFDFGFANAALRAGIPYYPKLTAAVPFTPATGRRVLTSPGIALEDVLPSMLKQVHAVADRIGASSIHALFVTPDEQRALAAHGLLARASYQFHFRREPGWASFDDYLAALRSPSRKQVRKEREQARAHGLQLSMRRGPEMTDADWQGLERFYRSTLERKQGFHFLTPEFFAWLRKHHAERVVGSFAHDGDVPVAGSLFLTRGDHLYGRYWGALRELPSMHFELCYYLPIAWALENGINLFEAGAQGEHKLKRGFLPAPCYSAHWFRHPGLERAIADFLPHEARAVAEEMAELSAMTPFKR